MSQPQKCSVRRYATEARVNGVKRIVYVASCASCGWRFTGSKSKRNSEAAAHC